MVDDFTPDMLDLMAMSIDALMDALLDPRQAASQMAVRAEIRRRAESIDVADPDITTPNAILLRAVDELRKNGWYEVAHACLVLFAGAVPDEWLLMPASTPTLQFEPKRQHNNPSPSRLHLGIPDANGLVTWVVAGARARAGLLRRASAVSITQSCRSSFSG